MLKIRLHILYILLLMSAPVAAQFDQPDDLGGMGNMGDTNNRQNRGNNDTQGNNKEIPIGMRVWTVDERFGDRTEAHPDTLPPMFMNTIFTTGLRGEYNTTGNLGAPRINRIFIDRKADGQFIFTQPYDFFIKRPQDFHFTNTLSPFTNLTFNTCGDRVNGEDHLTAKFGVNVNRQLGFGFNFDYIYGRGYYDSQSTAHFNYTMYGSYLGECYEAHLLASLNHQKVTENGGITDDNYIVHPESFNDTYTTSEIPTVLKRNWNRNDNQHILFTHRYNVGFNRKVPMTEKEIEARKFAMASQKAEQEKKAKKEGKDLNADGSAAVPAGRPENAQIVGAEPAKTDEKAQDRIAVNGKEAADSLMNAEKTAAKNDEWMKDEYVPVTSFIHTLQFDNYKRIFNAYETPENYYAATFDGIGPVGSDSIFDKTRHYQLRNTFAISMLEGFNKWAKAGVKIFGTSYLRHFTLPDLGDAYTTYNDHTLSIGGQLSKTQGKTLHYNALVEAWLLGEDAGQLKIDGGIDVNFPLFGDTVTLSARGFFHRLNPTFYYRHYHSRHLWWDNDDLSKIIHSRIEGLFDYKKTRTTLRVAVDEIKNHTYFGQSYRITDDFGRTANTVGVRQCGDAITLFTASLAQDFTLGPLNWENVITYQKSTNQDALSVPDLNIYTNLFLRFKIARVLSVDLGADARFFTSYYAPDYSPALGQYTQQEVSVVGDSEADHRIKVGNRPIVNVYANLHLKHTRFFIMMSHVNSSMGRADYFFTPHYPLNQRILRFGVSWNFFN
ncbi:MAG: putative porin [Prevotella sp.]|nr:putative porin [Prevotella sp.]